MKIKYKSLKIPDDKIFQEIQQNIQGDNHRFAWNKSLH